MFVLVRVPHSNLAERRYILEEILEHRIGLRIQIVPEDRVDTLLVFETGTIAIRDGFLAIAESEWLTNESMPAGPIWVNTLSESSPKIPVLPSVDTVVEPTITQINDRMLVEFDLLGSAFFFLSRYEEVAVPEEDFFQRYPAESAYAVRHGFIDRPVVDEYVNLIQACIARMVPEFQPLKRKFRMEVSHDVDLPMQFRWASFLWMLGGTFRDCMRTKSIMSGIRRIHCWYNVRFKNEVGRDPYNNFAEIMEQSEKRSLRSAFFFIADRPAGIRDAHYEIDDEFIQDLISTIISRGHEVGFHSSFNSYLDSDQTVSEWEKLKKLYLKLGCTQTTWGGRQHYLRWKTPFTYRNWDKAGLDYDSTMGFAKTAGFRCGTCHEFRPYDLLERKRIELLERPLVVMDTTVMNHMQLGTTPQALEYCIRLKNHCRAHEGTFTLLWHNSNLIKKDQWDLYLQILDA